MTLSIIIPVYRVENSLERCLQSIVGQSFTDWEAILVDDGSPDNCPAMCDAWAERDARFSVIHKENGGLSDARNAGIDIAKGDYITFVDSDDYLELDTYHQLMSVLEEKKYIDIIEFPVTFHKGKTEQKKISFSEKEFTDMSIYWLQAYGYEHCYACNKIFKQELFQHLRFTKDMVFEDVEIMPKLLKECRCLATSEKGLYHYCYNPLGITSTASGKDLNILFENHLNVMRNPKMLRDARYYMHVLNIQMDVFELNGTNSRLPFVRINPFTQDFTVKERLKALILNLFGIKGICRINKTLHKLYRSHS